jgi:DNA transformation protein
MAASRAFRDHVADLLSGFGPVAIRPMFGGAGVYREGVMFALIAYDTLYFKVDDATRGDYERAGLGPFTYEGNDAPVTMSYFQAPPEAMEDGELLIGCARKAFAAALRARAAKRRPRAERGTPPAR